jgi:hypothetical protein
MNMGTAACMVCASGTVPNQARTLCVAATVPAPALGGWWTAALAVALAGVALSAGLRARTRTPRA